MTDRRPLIALFVVVVLMVAAFLFTRAQDDSSAAPAQTTTTTTAVANPTTDATTSEGLLNPTANGDDWREGLTRVTDLENQLFQNPDPTRVGEIMVASCTCYQETVDRLTALKNNGQHVAGANIGLQNVNFLGQTGTDEAPRVQLITEIVSGGFPTVDSAGNTVEAAPASNQFPFRYFLDKGSDGLWRISDRGAVGAAQ